MNRNEFIEKIDSKLKLIRNEKEFSQDKMSEVLGVSKKTLVQIEKGRSSLGWSGAVVVCSLFKDSEIIQMILGEDTDDIIKSLAFGQCEIKGNKTMGEKVWWREIVVSNEYKFQQNIVSGHYRILDKDNMRVVSSFDKEYMENRLKELSEV